tara:strand:+ start:302 stop:922 length:621 start_codon:yes stop_codon:yes gene_type:complete
MAGSDVLSTYILASDIAAVDADGVSTSQTPSGAGNLTITGALASGGEATLVPARNVTVTSGGSSETGKNFTITGTDVNGNAVSEVIAGPGSSATVSTTKIFKVVTQVYVDAATAGAVTVGSGTTVSETIFAGRARIRGVYFVNSGSGGSLDFVNGNNGNTVMKLQTTGTAATADYPDVPDDGVLCTDGAFVNCLAASFTALTVFYN